MDVAEERQSSVNICIENEILASVVAGMADHYLMDIKLFKNSKWAGNTLGEYALLIGLGGVVVIAGISALGQSTSGLMEGIGKNQAAIELTQMNFGGTSSPQNKASSLPVRTSSGDSPYPLVTDPNTGMLQTTAGLNISGTNATSLDGSQRNSSGSMQIALSLESLAKTATTPEEANYYLALAKKAYLIGFVEATIDENNSPVGLSNAYSRDTAFQDLAIYQAQLKGLMINPPANLSRLGEAMALSSEVHNIGQEYINMIPQYQAKGQLTQVFQPPVGVTAQTPTQWESQDSAVAIDDLALVRDKAANIAGNNQTSSLKVQITLKDATQLDAMSQSKQ